MADEAKPDEADADSLTHMQRRFVNEYLVDLNATLAAKRAGYSEKTAHSQGPRLLENVEVARAIEEAEEILARETKIKAYQVIRELKLIGLSDLTNYEVDDNGKVTSPSDRNAMRAVASVKRKIRILPNDGGREVDVTITLWSKVEALKTLAQHLGMLKDGNASGEQRPGILVLSGLDEQAILGKKPPPEVKDEIPCADNLSS